MVVNCVEGILAQLFYLLIIAALLWKFHWSQISTVLEATKPGQSLLNPFDSTGIKDFNIWFVLMNLCVGIYGTMAWQNASAYNSAGYSPHENRMGGILGRWRDIGKMAFITLLGICAMTYLHHPDFAAHAAHVEAVAQQIADPHAREQMEVPIAIADFLPVGIKGLFCVVLLMGVFGGDATHLHSWGGILVQDVIVPRLKKPFGPRQHIWALRASITGVALFAFLFGILFTQTEYIIMWWLVTQAIFTGGAGSAIIGGLYWKKGTTQGAWVAMLTGSALSVGGILARQFLGDQFPMNGTQISFFATLIAIALYVVVSLLTCREDFPMDRMLHRGAYTRKDALADELAARKPPSLLARLLGFDEHFTLADKWIAGLLLGWTATWTIVFLVGTAWNVLAPWSLSTWSLFWEVVGIGIPVFIAFVTGLWFTWGGVRDIYDLFRRLRQEKINPLDDGTVVNHQNLDEISPDQFPH